jgi:hypothetical protein
MTLLEALVKGAGLYGALKLLSMNEEELRAL